MRHVPAEKLLNVDSRIIPTLDVPWPFIRTAAPTPASDISLATSRPRVVLRHRRRGQPERTPSSGERVFRQRQRGVPPAAGHMVDDTGIRSMVARVSLYSTASLASGCLVVTITVLRRISNPHARICVSHVRESAELFVPYECGRYWWSRFVWGC